MKHSGPGDEDLMQAMNAVEAGFVERRRKPCPGKAFDTTR